MGTGSGPTFGNTKGSEINVANATHSSRKTVSQIKHESKINVMKWAKQKRDELSGKTKKNFNTACVVYDIETGNYYYGRNGGYHEKYYDRNSLLFGDDTNAGLLPRVSMNKYPVGNCAEVDAVNHALNKGAKLGNLYMTTIHTTKNQFGNYKSACENCTYTFKGRINDNFSGWYKNEGE
ncbi:MAG: hypothetical protein K6G69_01420 [Lachnospiraceae bacterium]|nr:hypothetical protein [Lachnospiraceae bacterium]